MKQRYSYSIIYGLPGLFISAFIAILPAGAIAGVFWILVFGDNEWPAWAWWAITAVGIIVFIIALYFIVKMGYSKGKRLEIDNTPTNKKHILISLSTFVILFILMIGFQRGYLFEKPSSTVCRNLCIEKGYDGSGTSLSPVVDGKTTCSCFDVATKKYNEVEIIDYKQ
ncbi:hypothetical protein IID19_01850 [Patescibacteria group bacterium]|nr:hypothetical protein [Patescibacteria group bacterium]